MTAKEIADKLIREHALDGDFACLDDYKYLFEKIAKEYARQKCKEQRELCADEDGHPYGSDHILNAPEPKFN